MSFTGIADKSVGVDQQQKDRALRERQLADKRRVDNHAMRADNQRLRMEQQQHRADLKQKLFERNKQQQELLQKQQIHDLDVKKRQFEVEEMRNKDQIAHERRSAEEKLRKGLLQSGIAGLYSSAVTNIFSTKEALDYFNGRVGLESGKKGSLSKGYFDDSGRFVIEQVGEEGGDPIVTRMPVEQQISMIRWMYPDDDEQVDAFVSRLKETYKGNMKVQGKIDLAREKDKLKRQHIEEKRKYEEANEVRKQEAALDADRVRRDEGIIKDHRVVGETGTGASGKRDGTTKEGEDTLTLSDKDVTRIDTQIAALEEKRKNNPEEFTESDNNRLNGFIKAREQHESSYVDPAFDEAQNKKQSEEFARRIASVDEQYEAAKANYEKVAAKYKDEKTAPGVTKNEPIELKEAKLALKAAEVEQARGHWDGREFIAPLKKPEGFSQELSEDERNGVTLPQPKDGGFAATEYGKFTVTMPDGTKKQSNFSVNARPNGNVIELILGTQKDGEPVESGMRVSYDVEHDQLIGDPKFIANMKKVVGEKELMYIVESALRKMDEAELKIQEDELKRMRSGIGASKAQRGAKK